MPRAQRNGSWWRSGHAATLNPKRWPSRRRTRGTERGMVVARAASAPTAAATAAATPPASGAGPAAESGCGCAAGPCKELQNIRAGLAAPCTPRRTGRAANAQLQLQAQHADTASGPC